MPEYIINDEWVLLRVSKESSSFSNWLSDLKKFVASHKEEAQEAGKDITQAVQTKVALEQKGDQQDLPELVAVEEKLKEAEMKLADFGKKLSNLGGIGKYISDMTANISNAVTKKIDQSMKDSFSDLDINIDFVRGKRKTLATALYDVAKERGIDSDGILYLIQSLPDLESFLYSTSGGKFYRDHTEHQLRVAALGDFLLEQNLGNGNLIGLISDLTELDKNLIKDKVWWTMGLIHDIGYPLQKMTEAINWSLLNQILKCYPFLDIEVSPLEVSLFTKSKNQREYLTILEEGLSKEAKELLRKGSGLYLDTLPIPKKQVFIAGDNGHPEFKYKSEIELDHGVIGAMSLLKSIGSPQEIKENIDEYQRYIKASQAIALHNFKDKLTDFVFDKNPLLFLLVLVDEMQEWGRPIPLQVRDSYFTTELKKITLLDEIQLVIDEFQWLMAYKNMKAKQLIDFKFSRACEGKRTGFERLDKGKEFRQTRIVLQDYTLEKPEEAKLSKITKKEKLDYKELTKLAATALKEVAESSKDVTISKETQKEIDKLSRVEKKYEKTLQPQEKLLSEFYIVI